MSIELEVYCADCGRILESDFNPLSKRHVVTVCEYCAEEAHADGYKEGEEANK